MKQPPDNRPPTIDPPPMPPFEPDPALITYLEGGQQKKEKKLARANRQSLVKRLLRRITAGT